MSYLDVHKVILSFESEHETLQYITDALQRIISNYDSKKSFTFHNSEYDNNTELLSVVNTIIKKLIKLKEQPSISSINTENSCVEETL